MPNDFCSRASSKEWLTVSNAADRSNKTRKTFSPLSNDSIMSQCTRTAVRFICTSLHCRLMAELTKNFTENDKRNLTNTQLRCFQAEFPAEVNDLLIFVAVINIFLSITASLGNTLILAAIRKKTSLQPASEILYCNLAITDLCVGVIVQPVGAAYWISEVNEKWIIYYYTGLTVVIAAVILCLASLITVTAISVDRLLVLSLGFKYREVVTRKRENIIVVAIWVLSIVGPFSYAYVAISVSLCLFTLFFLTQKFPSLCVIIKFMFRVRGNRANQFH